jgi:acyl-coenzyme A thioesterase PaaI-like protein
MTSSTGSRRDVHPLAELGLVVQRRDDGLRGTAATNGMMLVPGTSVLRMSILAAWADTVLGLLAIDSIAPRVPVTLELDVHLAEPAAGIDEVVIDGRVAKAGSSVVTSMIEFSDASGHRFGVGHSMFMANPDDRMRMPAGDWALNRLGSRRGTLTSPFAQRVGCRRIRDGVASIEFDESLGNQSQTMNGGILALAVEEAALSADDPGATLASMTLRFVRPMRTGPAVARADLQRGLADVSVQDEATGALAILATTRSFPPPSGNEM